VKAARELSVVVGPVAAADALGVSRATLHRRGRPPRPPAPRRTRRSPRALSSAERQVALGVLNEERFVDKAPATVVATLLDEGRYVASERTLYRVLAENGQIRERRDQRRHPPRTPPRLCARAPRQVWSWDITPLPGPARGTFFQLYVMLDLFSRYAVAWMVAPRQTAALAGNFVQEAVRREGVAPGTLIAHSDRGPPMTARSLALLYAELGVTQSLSRPRVSDDNPYSESHFKTVKYHPSYPDHFVDQEHARRHFEPFFRWYNHEHRHVGIAMLTPADVHHGRIDHVLAIRQATLDAAFAARPERFPRGRPLHARPPEEVWINPPAFPVAPDANAHQEVHT
jgi:putative transposase